MLETLRSAMRQPLLSPDEPLVVVVVVAVFQREKVCLVSTELPYTL